MSKPKPKMKGYTRSCAQKQPFETMQQAEDASRRGRFDFMHAYKCRKCDKYHYGHPSAKHLPRMAA
jgi:hypothetical protein